MFGVEQAHDRGERRCRGRACGASGPLRRACGSWAAPRRIRGSRHISRRPAWRDNRRGSDIACARARPCRSPGYGRWRPCRTRRRHRRGASASALSRSISSRSVMRFVAVEIGPGAALLLAGVAGFAVVAMAQHLVGLRRWSVTQARERGERFRRRHEWRDSCRRLPTPSVLIMATNRFEESELFGPREILLRQGRDGDAGVARHASQIMGDGARRAGQDDHARPDRSPTSSADDYDALLLPGGVGNPDRLRMRRGGGRADQGVRRGGQAGRRRSAMAPWLLVEADVLRGRRATSWPSIRTDLRNAGARGGRRGGGDRRQYRHQPQARRRPGLHRRADRGDRGELSGLSRLSAMVAGMNWKASRPDRNRRCLDRCRLPWRRGRVRGRPDCAARRGAGRGGRRGGVRRARRLVADRAGRSPAGHPGRSPARPSKPSAATST